MPKVSDDHLAARRQQILDAAARCFARDGFHNTSVHDIVRESGISAGLVYRYFTGKDDMIVAIVEDWHAKRATQLDDTLNSYLDLLRRIASPEAAQQRNLSMQAWAETIRNPRIRDLARKGVDDQLKAGRVLVAIYQGLLLQAAWDDDLDVEAFVESVRELVQRRA